MSRFTRKSALPCSSVLYVLFIPILYANKDVLESVQSATCENNEYYDTVTFSCVQCDYRKNLKPSADRSRCACNEFSKTVGSNNNYPECIPCGSNMTVTADGRDCIPCYGGKCRCDTNEIQIDRNLNGTLLDALQCLPCSYNTYPSLDNSKCLPCDNFGYSYYLNNIYSTKYYTQLRDSCLYKNNISNNANTSITSVIKFESQNIDSYYFKRELEIAIYFCRRKDTTACEHLSNMCALTLYTHKTACMLFMRKQLTSIWLMYNKNETATVMNSEKITQNYSLLKYRNDSTLNFIFATFSLNGNFKAIDSPNMPCDLLKYVRFGMNVRKTCKLQIKDLLNRDIEFIYPYLTFAKDQKMLMHTVPICIKNTQQDFNDISNEQLVRKFFIVDNVSGIKSLSNFTNGNTRKSDKLHVLRYMKSLTVIINIQNTKRSNKIFPPLLIVEYAELTDEQISETTEVTLNYEIKFISNSSNINFNLEIIIGIFSGLSLIFSGIKTWNYRKRHYTSTLYITLLLWFFIYALGNIGSTIIAGLIFFSIYLFIFYGGQTVPYILYLDHINENTIKIFTAIALFLKLIEIVGFICQYLNINIFFIDWEQPKTVYNDLNYEPPYLTLYKLYGNKFSRDKYKLLQTPSEAITAKRKKLNELNASNYSLKSKSNFLPRYSVSKICMQSANEQDSVNKFSVSIWRTYFIANKWLKLQTKRKISIIAQLLGVLCIYQITQLCPWILAKLELTSKSYTNNYNFILYYTVCIVIYILVYCIQWVLSITFYEKCITNEIQKFISLCSVANISMFILPFNYHGFYIHGRSVHGFADTDLPTLMDNLQKEKYNLCAHKGLIPGTTQQTFILSLTTSFRNKLNKLLLKAETDKTLNVQFELKQFFCQFVDHCLKDEDYIIKEPCAFEKLCNVLLYQRRDKSLFYADNNHTFDQVLFYGNEWLFFTFEVSLFAFIIVIYEDCILATIITLLISMLLIIIVNYNSKRNLCNNTLLDKIFL